MGNCIKRTNKKALAASAMRDIIIEIHIVVVGGYPNFKYIYAIGNVKITKLPVTK